MSGEASLHGRHEVGDLVVDTLRREVTVQGRRICLTTKEFDLLAALAAHPGWVFSKEQLFDSVWASEYNGDTRVVGVHLSNLRRKLGEDPRGVRYLHTVRGAGYKLEPQSAGEAPIVPRPVAHAGAPRLAAPRLAAPVRLPLADRALLRMPDVFVGREHEKAALHRALEDVRKGSCRTVIVSGEPGIGKTRLAEEFVAEARLRGAAAVWAREVDDAGTPPFWPCVQALRQLLAGSPTEGLGELLPSAQALLRRLLPDVRDQSGAAGTPEVFDPDEARFRLFQSVADVLTGFAASRPLVLVIDDIHWAPAPSLHLLEFLVRELRESPVMLLLTYRDTDVDRGHPLRRTLAALTRERSCRRLYLEGLSEEEVGSYLGEVGSIPTSLRLVSELHRKSEGNPFFIEEIIRILITEDGFPGSSGLTSASIALPDEVREAILRRLDRISSGAMQVLFAAALIGREHSLPLLERVTQLSKDQLLDLLQEAIQAHVIEETAVPGVFRFNHELTREVLYRELPAPSRLRLHLQVGQAIERLHAGDLDEHIPALAHHFYHAGVTGRPAQAIAYCVDAARQALEQCAYEDCARYHEQALRLLEIDQEADEVGRCRLLLGLGEALMRAGSPRGRQVFSDAAAIAERLDDPVLLARAALQYDGRIVGPMGIDFERLRRLELAVRAIGPGDSRLTVRLLALLAKALAELGASVAEPGDPYSLERRRRLSLEAVTMARRLNDAEALTYALTATHVALHRPDNLAERLAEAKEIVRLSVVSGNRLAALYAYYFWYNDLVEAGDLDEAAEVLEAGRSLAQEFRLTYHLGYVDIVSATRLSAEGRFREARSLLEGEALLGALDAEQPRFAVIAQVSASFVPFLLCGDSATGSEIEAGLRHLALGDPIGWAWTSRLARLLAHLGKTGESRRLFEGLAGGGFRDVPPVEGWLSFLSHVSETAVLLGDQARAAILLHLLAPYEDRLVSTMHVIEGLVTYDLGILASLLGRYVEAEHHFARTVARGAELGLIPEVVRAQAGWAEMRLRRDGPGDRVRAAVLADESLRQCQDMGMDSLAATCARLAAEARQGTNGRSRRAQGGRMP